MERAIGGGDFTLMQIDQLPKTKGVYAIYIREASALPEAYQRFIEPARPIYIGRTRASFASRDLRTHFGTGKSGSSTLRKTLIAVLDLPAIPRDALGKPASFSNYKTTPESEETLTRWMRTNLLVGIHESQDPDGAERTLLKKYNPPLNLKDIVSSDASKALKAARKRKREEARGVGR